MLKQLLAKRPKTDGTKLSLKQHLIDTDDAALAIFKGRMLQNWCRFFRVRDPQKFLIHLRIAALFHDMGKANAEFYAAVQGSREKQTLRHEWFSAFILHLPKVRNWLATSGLDLEVITAAVLCHHLQAHPKEWGKPRTLVKQVELYLTHPEVTDILEKIAQLAGVENLPELPQQWVAGNVFWNQVYQDANDVGDDFFIDIQDDDEQHNERRSLLLAVKAGVIAADSVASAMFREKDYTMQQWLDKHLHQRAITSEEIETKILQPRYRQIEKKSGNTFELRPFQEKAKDLGDRVLLLSACGSGKTIFGYKWHQSVLSRHQVGHLIFLYPTRGTATEGFKDYVSSAPESDASLLTGTASYELQEIAQNPTESTQGKDYTTDERLFALGFWGKRFFSATVDQFLSFLTHSYSGLCLLPVLADSVVVIDEVHSFSKDMFDNLISFLQHFDIPVLCMTATLPKSRRQQLEKVGLKVFASDADEELTKVEQQPRYLIEKTDFQTAFQRAIEAYQQDKCILWVVNTVDRCRETAADLEQELGVNVLTYHSRFRLMDRQEQHKATVAAFAFNRGQRQPVIAVTTQVCEMSLDLDADVLISELAPISSLVQRFGRSNRSSERQKTFRSQILVYEPPNIRPYKDDELKAAQRFMTEVIGEVSQWKLAVELERYSPGERFADGGSSFVHGGYWAFSQPFRDTDDYSMNALLDSDLNAVKELIKKRKFYDQYVLPVPKKFALPEDRRPEWIPNYMAIADRQFYCPKRGFGE
ncbi:CRISPR-associated protein Cas3 [Scytonema hofmannii PCC 7110]|uniref:CRISPR-associated protein Cas3 n=1 Tax=Scytonema hofmannii PCC 7110 TaxID=128403 RepID=A0A139XGR5_9CYAN|nr:CRISPR-associated helicase/endonuclease Cas3 [Scytonema hofmannii]KYC43859.1 CRISPR-associated protein Cas3 [Scytonema hofmannii PCC 7110]